MAPTMFIFLPEKCHVGTIEQYIATLMVIKVVFLAKKNEIIDIPILSGIIS